MGQVGLKWENGDGQAAPCMGRCMGGAWRGVWMHGCMVIGDVVMHGIWGLGVVWLVMVGRLLVWYHHT